MQSLAPIGINRTLMPTLPALIVAMAGALLALVSLAIGFLSGQPEASLLVAVGFLSFAAITTAIWARKSFDVLDPIVMFIVSTLIGGTMRSMYLAWSPQYYEPVQQLIGNMRASEIAAYEAPIPIGMAFMALGYLLWRWRFPIAKIPGMKNTVWPAGRTYIIVAIYAAIGMVGVYTLIKSTGVSITGLAGLSAKRTVDMSNMGGSQYAHAGYLRWLADCLKGSLLLLFALWGARTNPDGSAKRFGLVRVAILFGLTMACEIWPFISSSRTAVAEIVFDLVIIFIYMRNRGSLERFIRIGAICVMFGFAVLVIMGMLRNLSQRGEIRQSSPMQTFSDQVFGSGNFLPSEREAYIIAHYQGRPFFYGSTYFVWLAEPIPRTIWPERPSAGDLAEFVKGDIYGRDVIQGGYPAGIFGEAYINFGYPGLFFMPFLFGCLMRFVYVSFEPLLGVNRNATLIYAAILWPIGFQIADNDFSEVMMNVLTSALPLGLAFLIMKRPPRTLPAPA